MAISLQSETQQAYFDVINQLVQPKYWKGKLDRLTRTRPIIQFAEVVLTFEGYMEACYDN